MFLLERYSMTILRRICFKNLDGDNMRGQKHLLVFVPFELKLVILSIHL